MSNLLVDSACTRCASVTAWARITGDISTIPGDKVISPSLTAATRSNCRPEMSIATSSDVRKEWGGNLCFGILEYSYMYICCHSNGHSFVHS